MKKIDVRRIAVLGMFCAISFVMVLVGRLVPNVAGFLSYDPKDAIIAIAGCIFGPISAVIISVVVSLIEMLSLSGTGIYGFIMNVFSTCAFVVPVAVIYKKNRSFKGALIGLIVGVFSITSCMLLWNYIITPYYMKVPRNVVSGMLLSTFLPFNFVKGGINMALTLILYKPIVSALRKARLLNVGNEKETKKKDQLGIVLLSLFLLVTFVLLFLIFSKVL